MTEKESAHPTTQQLNELTTVATANGDLVGPVSPTSVVPPQLVREDDLTAADDMAPVPQGTGIQPPTESHALPAVEDIKISDKVKN